MLTPQRSPVRLGPPSTSAGPQSITKSLKTGAQTGEPEVITSGSSVNSEHLDGGGGGFEKSVNLVQASWVTT